MKNNYLMNTIPVGPFKILEIHDVHDPSNKNNFNRSKTSKNMHASEAQIQNDINPYFLKKRTGVVDSQPQDVKEESKKPSRRHQRNKSNDLNHKQEQVFIRRNLAVEGSNSEANNLPSITQGLTKLNQLQKDKEQLPYMRSRVKETNKILELNRDSNSLKSSSIGTLPKVNITAKEGYQLRKDGSANPNKMQHQNNQVYNKNPKDGVRLIESPKIVNSKYKNSKIVFDTTHQSNLLMHDQPEENLRVNSLGEDHNVIRNKDRRPNKIVMKNAQTNSSNSTTGLLQNQMIDSRNYISTRNTHGPQIKLNYHRTSLSPVDPKHLPGSKNNMVETVAATAGNQLPLQKAESHNSDLISPRMMRTKPSEKRGIDNITHRLKEQNFVQLIKNNSANPNTEQVEKLGGDSDRKSKLDMKRSHSRGSRIEGKLNEDEMLPLAEDLSEEELIKYQLQ